MSSKTRRDEIKRLICEGWDARVAGVHIQNCPSSYIGTMNWVHWKDGWLRADQATKFEESRLEELAGMSDEEKARRGSLIAETLLLTKVNGTYPTEWGTKSPMGIFNTVARLLLQGK